MTSQKMEPGNTKSQSLEAILQKFSQHHQKEIAEINKQLVYNKWAFSGEYQYFINVDNYKELIQKYNLRTIDPRTIQEFVDSYNEEGWFRRIPEYYVNGLGTSMKWITTETVYNSIKAFLSKNLTNNTRNIFNYIDSSTDDFAYQLGAAIVWNKMDIIANDHNKYAFKVNLMNGTYEDGTLIGTLAKKNYDEDPVIVTLANIMKVIKNHVLGNDGDADLLGIDSKTLKAACNINLNRVISGIPDIKTIKDFWDSNLGKSFPIPYGKLDGLQALEQAQKNLDNALFAELEKIDFSNSSISICNMTQNIAGSVLALDSSSINVSQTCEMTSEKQKELEQKLEKLDARVTSIENELKDYGDIFQAKLSESIDKANAIENNLKITEKALSDDINAKNTALQNDLAKSSEELKANLNSINSELTNSLKEIDTSLKILINEKVQQNADNIKTLDENLKKYMKTTDSKIDTVKTSFENADKTISKTIEGINNSFSSLISDAIDQINTLKNGLYDSSGKNKIEIVKLDLENASKVFQDGITKLNTEITNLKQYQKNSLEEQLRILSESSYPKIIFSYVSKLDSFTNKLYEKLGTGWTLTISIVVAVVILACFVGLFTYFIYKDASNAKFLKADYVPVN